MDSSVATTRCCTMSSLQTCCRLFALSCPLLRESSGCLSPRPFGRSQARFDWLALIARQVSVLFTSRLSFSPFQASLSPVDCSSVCLCFCLSSRVHSSCVPVLYHSSPTYHLPVFAWSRNAKIVNSPCEQSASEYSNCAFISL